MSEKSDTKRSEAGKFAQGVGNALWFLATGDNMNEPMKHGKGCACGDCGYKSIKKSSLW